ncbi:MAG: hypothetical protein HGA27_06175 [Peptococcaceae bacterium]|nr:hypothetical protein [Peptococcaceae bacterium]
MKKMDIESSLQRAIEQAPSIDFHVLANKPVIKMSDHDFITKQPIQEKNQNLKKLLVVYTCCLFSLVFFTGWLIQYKVPDSVIALDVNPSIELVTNKHDQILLVKALNDDAKKIIAGKEFKNNDLFNTVDVLINSMISQGYLNTDKNIIMVSVENKDPQKGESLSLILGDEIRKDLSSKNISPRILRQVYSENKEISALAKQYGTSSGNIKLINEIISSDKNFSIKTLSNMPVKDLLAISKEKAVDLHRIIKFDDENIVEGSQKPNYIDKLYTKPKEYGKDDDISKNRKDHVYNNDVDNSSGALNISEDNINDHNRIKDSVHDGDADGDSGILNISKDDINDYSSLRDSVHDSDGGKESGNLNEIDDDDSGSQETQNDK